MQFWVLKTKSAKVAKQAAVMSKKIVAYDSTKIIKDVAAEIDKQIKMNPFLKDLLTAPLDSKNYKKAFKKITAKTLPQLNGFRALMSSLNYNNARKLIADMQNAPQLIARRLQNMGKEQLQKVGIAWERDVNEAALSSSWLAYGSFIPKDSENPTKGSLLLTTKDSDTFEVVRVSRSLWTKMRDRIGISKFKKGKRVGANYGAGTILCRGTNRKTQWKNWKSGGAIKDE